MVNTVGKASCESGEPWKIAGKWIVYPQKNSIVVGIDPSPTDM